MKKVNVLNMLIFLLFALVGCKEKASTIKVSSYSELLSASNSNVNIRLNCDIDCEFDALTNRISCIEFDGQGYTIKNCIISNTGYFKSFFNASKLIKNVNFDNITVKADNSVSAAVVSSDIVGTIENVNIKNCKITSSQAITGSGLGRTIKSNYVGGIYGGARGEDAFRSTKCDIINCSVDGLQITSKGHETTNVYDTADLYVGGIAGAAGNIKNCSVINSTLSSESTMVHMDPYVGGLAGLSEGNIENSYSKDNILNAKANYCTKPITGYYSTSANYIGGIAGSSEGNGVMQYCYSEGITIESSSTGDLYNGGLIGKSTGINITQCYTKDNNIFTSGYATGNKDEVQRRAAGFIGSANSNNISSCFSYGCNILEESSGFAKANDSRTMGFISGFSNLKVSNCATKNRSLNSTTTDEFMPYYKNVVTDCYVSSEMYNNAYNLEIVDDDFWTNLDIIKEKLALFGNKWMINDGEIPYLDL